MEPASHDAHSKEKPGGARGGQADPAGRQASKGAGRGRGRGRGRGNSARGRATGRGREGLSMDDSVDSSHHFTLTCPHYLLHEC